MNEESERLNLYHNVLYYSIDGWYIDIDCRIKTWYKVNGIRYKVATRSWLIACLLCNMTRTPLNYLNCIPVYPKPYSPYTLNRIPYTLNLIP